MPASNAVIGALRATLGLDTAQFENGLKGAQSSLQKFGKFASVGLAAAGAAALASAGAFAVFAKRSIDVADRMGDLAASVGVSTESLSRLGYAASLSGSDLDGLTVGLKKLSANLGSIAAGGGGAAATAFSALGISATDAAGKLRAPDQVLLDVAEKFARMENGATKTSLAMMVFGKSGADLIPMLNEGRNGLAAMSAESDKLGQTIHTLTSAQAQQFNDNLDKIGKVGDGFTNLVVGKMLPSMTALSNSTLDLALDTGLLQGAADGLVFVLKAVASVAVLVGAEIAKVSIRVGSLYQALGKIAQGKFDGALVDVMLGMVAVEDAARRSREMIDGIWAGTSGAPALVTDRHRTLVTPLLEDLSTAKTAFDTLKSEAQSLQDGLRDPFAEMTAGLARYGQMLKAKLIDQNQFQAAAMRMQAGTVAAYAGMASQITGTLSQMFKDNKAFAVANAIVSGIEGVAKTLSAYPAPWSFAMAGVQAAAAAAQVAGILSTNEGSTSMPSTVPTTGGVPTGAAAGASGGPVFNVEIIGKFFSANSVRGLISDINEVLGDGTPLGGR